MSVQKSPAELGDREMGRTVTVDGHTGRLVGVFGAKGLWSIVIKQPEGDRTITVPADAIVKVWPKTPDANATRCKGCGAWVWRKDRCDDCT